MTVPSAIQIVFDDVVQCPVSTWLIRQPIANEWFAVVRCGAIDVNRGSRVTITDGENEWVGAIRDILPDGPQVRLEIVGGAGGLSSDTVARYYPQGATTRSLLADHCGDVGETPDDIDGMPVGRWRSRGGSLRSELTAIARWTSGAWRMTPGGSVSLSVASGEADSPGILSESMFGCRTYQSTLITPLAGMTVDDVRVGLCIHSGSPDEPMQAQLWQHNAVADELREGSIGGRVVAYINGRVDVQCDDGQQLIDVPLWAIAGIAPQPTAGTRVIILDLNDDPRATIALCGVGGDVDQIDIGSREMSSDYANRPVCFGDTIMMPVGAAATPTPTIVEGPPFPTNVSKARFP